MLDTAQNICSTESVLMLQTGWFEQESWVTSFTTSPHWVA